MMVSAEWAVMLEQLRLVLTHRDTLRDPNTGAKDWRAAAYSHDVAVERLTDSLDRLSQSHVLGQVMLHLAMKEQA